MPKKIIYWVQGYRPKNEAVSKEIKTLYEYFRKQKEFSRVTIHDLSIRPFKFLFNKNYVSYYNKYIPIGLIIIPILSKRYDISHIYTSLGDLPYLTLLEKKPIILTAALSASFNKIKKRKNYYKKIDKIVVESYKDKDYLISIGVDPNKIVRIFPGIELSKFSYKKTKNNKFTILFASSPPKLNMFKSTGTNLLLGVAKELENQVDFIFLWRKIGYKKLISKIKKLKIKNVKIINKTIKDMNKIYAMADATIATPLIYHEFKPIPNTIIESMASGKPVLVSNITGIKDLIIKEKCGITFDPNKNDIIKSISKLKKDYDKYQKNCLKTANKHFSKDLFVREYEKIYKDVTSQIKN